MAKRALLLLLLQQLPESAGRLRKTDSSNDADDKEAEAVATSSNRQFFLHGVLREFAVLKAGGAEGNQGLLSDE